MKQIIISLFTVLCLTTGCTSQPTQTGTAGPDDSLYTAKRAMKIYAAEPRHALQLIDTIETVGNEPDFMCDYLRAIVYSRSSLQCHDSAIAICTALLEHDSLQADNEASITHRTNVLSVMCSSYRMQRDYDSWLRRNTELTDLCRRQGDETEALRADAETGYILTQLGLRKEAMALLDNTIAALDAPGSVNRLDACIIAIKRKINILEESGPAAEIIPLAQHILQKITHFRQHTADYADDSYRLPASAGQFESYCAFTEAQAYCFLANAYAAENLKDSTRHRLAIYDQTPYSKTYGGRRMALPARLVMGDYDEVLAICREEEKRLKTDTFTANYATILRFRAQVAEKRHQYEKATALWQRYARLENALNESLQASTAHTYAARFHAQELQSQLERHQAFLKTIRLYIIGGLILCLLVVAFAMWQLRQKRLLDAKNRVLAQQIAEVVRLKAPIPQAAEESVKEQSAPQTAAAPTPRPTAAELKQMSEIELFEFICNDIRTSRLFVDPTCDRQKLADRYGLSFAQIGAAFARGSSYDSVAEFIRDCRLEFACALLTDTDMMVAEVAQAAGFSRITTFNHDFKAQYSLSPSEYRKQNQEPQV